ncbi:MAG: zinc ribbon domain-containing protein [Deltaproteobacteria bacterium]|nr:zinc ribbon domain-containing protein [Deltaproteobacteria bacterium]MCL5276827.1 zinc ribbon domain-containing protein [Deltaproteobacteria bacterium]
MLQKISEKPISACPKCKGKVKRLISDSSSFILKGSGWYETDYGKNNKPGSTSGSKPVNPSTDKTPPDNK